MTSPTARKDLQEAPVNLQDLVDVMAEATARYPFKRWGFGESIAMEALLEGGGAPGEFAARLVAEWAVDHTPFRNDPLAHVAPGVPLLQLVEAANRPIGASTEAGLPSSDTLLQCAVDLATVFEHSDVGEHGAQIHRPDLAGWEHEVWVDCMHLDGPFLAHLARITGDDRYWVLAGDILLNHARVLQDEASGLFSHGFNDDLGRANGIHWGRGEGWALLGLLDTARQLPAGHVRTEATQRLTALVEGLARHEAGAGSWRTVVDEPGTAIESSVGAFVALGVHRAIRHGLVDRSWSAMAERAWEATRDLVSPEGLLAGVSDATPVGDDAAHYDTRPHGSFPWGQGPALLAALDRLRGDAADSEVLHD